MSINYSMTLTLCLTPITLLWYFGFLSGKTASILGAIGAIGFPLFFYRSSRSWWLMLFFFFLPAELPANADREHDH